MNSRTCASVSNLLVVILLLGLCTTTHAEDWVQAWGYDNPDEGKAASVAIDRDSCKLTPNGNVTYKLRLLVNGTTVFITCDASPQKRFRSLKREYPDGKVEVPGDGGKHWQWRDFSGRTGDLEYAVIAPYFSRPQSERWVKFCRDANQTHHYFDSESLVWADQDTCRVFVTEAGDEDIASPNKAKLVVLHRDRTYELGYTGRPGPRYSIPPESIIEILWKRLFK